MTRIENTAANHCFGPVSPEDVNHPISPMIPTATATPFKNRLVSLCVTNAAAANSKLDDKMMMDEARLRILPWWKCEASREECYAMMSWITWPLTSVSRMSRPPKRNVDRVWSTPIKCNIVACRSWISTRFSIAL